MVLSFWVFDTDVGDVGVVSEQAAKTPALDMAPAESKN
jgi:hypothetical protein